MSRNILYPELPLLLVDDEEAWLRSFGLLLRSSGISNLKKCSDSRRVIPLLKEESFCAIILDLIMPHVNGEELLEQIVAEQGNAPVIILTGLDQVEPAVRCMKKGAYDFFTKVTEEERLLSGIRRAIELGRLRQENVSLKEHFFDEAIKKPECFEEIVTLDRGLLKLFGYMEAIAPSGEAVLISGETGVGKELFARALHKLSNLTGKFVPVNAAGLDDEMFADTLFGHTKGAFTGAAASRPGLIEQAAGGTLFLDEIGDLSTASQIKLLRLLQEREFHPLGSDFPKKTDARMFFATHRDLKSMVAEGSFRKDLFFRLQAHHIRIPPLRDRLDDLHILVEHLLARAAGELGKKIPAYPKELILLLGTYSFPGNVRELYHMVHNALSGHVDKVLSMQSFRQYITDNSEDFFGQENIPSSDRGTIFSALDRLPTLKEVDDLLIEEALNRSKGNQSIAADMLGISRQGLNWRIRRKTSEEDKP